MLEEGKEEIFSKMSLKERKGVGGGRGGGGVGRCARTAYCPRASGRNAIHHFIMKVCGIVKLMVARPGVNVVV